MKPALKHILALGLLILLVLHITFVFSYAAPVSVGAKLRAASARYCYPFFHQQWTVFVPAPDRKSDLYIRSRGTGIWNPWQNVMARFISRHRRNPMAGGEAEVLLLSNSLNYLGYELGAETPVFNEAPDLPAFRVVQRAASYVLRSGDGTEKSTHYELLLVTQTREKKYACYFKNLSL